VVGGHPHHRRVLYDLKTDPWELESVHDDPRYAEIKSILRAAAEGMRTARRGVSQAGAAAASAWRLIAGRARLLPPAPRREVVQMSESNRRYLLRERPSGRIDASTFDQVTEPVPEIGTGEALIRTEYISIDPTNRGWLNDTPTYLPPVQIGEVVRAVGLGRVVASNNPAYEEGKLFQGLIGWQEWFVASDSAPLIPVTEMPGVESPSAYIGVLGMTGLTAWVGIHEIGRPKEGETVVVSAAAGAVGSVAGQLAKAYGARVVGIAGGPEKCALLTDELGFDAAVDYKADGWQKQLIDATPDGIDVDFENVGGEIMELIFGRLNLNSRVALCGLISGYNEDDLPPGPRTIGNVLIKRAMIKGFIVIDHFNQAAEAGAEIGGLMAAGKVKALETVVEGFERLPDALNMLFDGANTGKLSVKI
jgi:NADPH-dependent curcumin reductase CurA